MKGQWAGTDADSVTLCFDLAGFGLKNMDWRVSISY